VRGRGGAAAPVALVALASTLAHALACRGEERSRFEAGAGRARAVTQAAARPTSAAPAALPDLESRYVYPPRLPPWLSIAPRQRIGRGG
jgi:hypothetical protein